jgi:hypothetical protein
MISSIPVIQLLALALQDPVNLTEFKACDGCASAPSQTVGWSLIDHDLGLKVS